MEMLTRPTASLDGLRLPWSWCGRCQRTYPTGACRMVRFRADALHPHPAPLELCPYHDCSGSMAHYQWPWANIRLQHPEYPVTPSQGIVYVR